jgi:hypothetical protein
MAPRWRCLAPSTHTEWPPHWRQVELGAPLRWWLILCKNCCPRGSLAIPRPFLKPTPMAYGLPRPSTTVDAQTGASSVCTRPGPTCALQRSRPDQPDLPVMRLATHAPRHPCRHDPAGLSWSGPSPRTFRCAGLTCATLAMATDSFECRIGRQRAQTSSVYSYAGWSHREGPSDHPERSRK